MAASDDLAVELLADLKLAVSATWREVTALQTCLGDEGPRDVLHPDLWDELTDTATRIRALAEALQRLFGACELPEPTASELQEMREALALDALE